jgi:hypothetical protein
VTKSVDRVVVGWWDEMRLRRMRKVAVVIDAHDSHLQVT